MYNLLNNDSFFTHELRRDMLKAYPEELAPFRSHMPSSFVDFSEDVYLWPDLNKSNSVDFDLVVS